jgi:hypothetical protein
MSEFIPTEKGVPIRQPSTANLMLSSQDRIVFPVNVSLDNAIASASTAANFVINKNYSILNGFFTRIGVTEVVMNWAKPNILDGYNNSFDISFNSNFYSLTIPQGNYTVAECLNAMIDSLNEDISGVTWSLVGIPTSSAAIPNNLTTINRVGITNSGPTNFEFWDTSILSDNANVTRLPSQLGFAFSSPGSASTVAPVHYVGESYLGVYDGETTSPNLQIVSYVDIISPSLTYNQALKDGATSQINSTVLCRWYFAEDTPEQLDPYGFPILQGYKPFKRRRIYSPPKQIRWDPTSPLGNLEFQVTSDLDQNTPLNQTNIGGLGFEWEMTLQVSEV